MSIMHAQFFEDTRRVSAAMHSVSGIGRLMPTRVVRGEDLLSSDKYMNLDSEAQIFYLHLWFSADDFGLFQLSPSFLGRRCFRKMPSVAKLNRLIELLQSKDFLRIYEFEESKYVFIPNYGQRLQSFRTKCPMPPPELYADDEDAKQIFNKYRVKFKKFAVLHRKSTQINGESPSEVEVEVEGEVEVEVEGEENLREEKGKSEGEEIPSSAVEDGPPLRTVPSEEPVSKGRFSKGGRDVINAYTKVKAAQFNLKQRPEETVDAFADRVDQIYADMMKPQVSDEAPEPSESPDD
jgi:hypothetical protein